MNRSEHKVLWFKKDVHGIYRSKCGRFEIQKCSGCGKPVEYRLDALMKSTTFHTSIGDAKMKALAIAPTVKHPPKFEGWENDDYNSSGIQM